MFSFIASYSEEHGFAPTCREIGSEAGLSSTSSVYYVLGRLEAKGYIHRMRKRKGGLAVVAGMDGTVRVSQADLIALLAEMDGFSNSQAFRRLAAAAGVA